jgi:serine/threonine protein kinase
MLTGLPPHFSENREEMYRRILHNPVDYPRYLSINSKNILKALLTKDPDNRLGSMMGAKEIKEHPFCKDINWDSVYSKKLIPPIRPSLRYSNFD